MTSLFKKRTILLTILWIVGISACSDDDTNPQPMQSGYTTAQAYLEEIGFSGSVLIRKGNSDLVRTGFGLADVSNNIPNDPALIYRTGSITKSFTAAALVNLKRDGLIDSFDQPLSDFSEAFPYGDQITIRHLLTHHSGIPDYVGPVEDFADANNYFFDTEEILEIIMEGIVENGLIFTPGEFFQYANSNYMILGLLIEELSGQPYQQYLNEKVYTPLGMGHTGKGPDEILGADRAQGYDEGAAVDAYQMQIAFSAGEIESTIADLEKWGDALLNNYFTAEERLDVFAAPFDQEGVNTVGFGWFTRHTNSQVVYHHGGDIEGFTSLLVLIPESNGLIILLSNEQNKGAQRDEIMETILREEF